MTILARITAAATRLLHRGRRRPAAVDSLAGVLDPASETGAVITMPGLAAWLGREQDPDGTDFLASLDGGLLESYEDFCERISKQAV